MFRTGIFSKGEFPYQNRFSVKEYNDIFPKRWAFSGVQKEQIFCDLYNLFGVIDQYSHNSVGVIGAQP